MNRLNSADLPSLNLAGEATAYLARIVGETAPGREACGLLGGHVLADRVFVATTVRPLANVTALRGCFAVDVDDVLAGRAALERRGQRPVALFHTHPSGSLAPSLGDTRLPAIIGLPSLIVAAHGGQLGLAALGPGPASIRVVCLPDLSSCWPASRCVERLVVREPECRPHPWAQRRSR